MTVILLLVVVSLGVLQSLIKSKPDSKARRETPMPEFPLVNMEKKRNDRT